MSKYKERKSYRFDAGGGFLCDRWSIFTLVIRFPKNVNKTYIRIGCIKVTHQGKREKGRA